MLCELADEVLEVIESCGPCSGKTLSGTVFPGSAGSAGDAGGGNRRSKWDDEEVPWHERPDHEKKMRLDNLDQTSGGLLMKFINWNWNWVGRSGFGRMLGPLDTIATGAVVGAQGIEAVVEAGKTRDQRIHEQSGGYFPPPGQSHGSGGQNQPSPETQQTPEESARQQKGKERAEDILKEIRERTRRDVDAEDAWYRSGGARTWR